MTGPAQVLCSRFTPPSARSLGREVFLVCSVNSAGAGSCRVGEVDGVGGILGCPTSASELSLTSLTLPALGVPFEE